MAKHCANAETNKVVEGFVALGWLVDQRKKHLTVRNPIDANDFITVSNGAAPGGWERLKRLKSRLRRAQEAWASRERERERESRNEKGDASMKWLLGGILFFVLFGWLGVAAAIVVIVKYFWIMVALLAIWVFRRPLGGLMDRAQGVPVIADDRPVCPKCSGYGAFYSVCNCVDGKAPRDAA